MILTECFLEKLFHVVFSILLLAIKSKLQWINYLGWGRESLFVCYRLIVIMWFPFGFPLPLGTLDGLRHFIVTLPEPSI